MNRRAPSNRKALRHPSRRKEGKENAVRAWTEEVVIPTYMPAAPDPNPMFLERRVYQGSSGKVYPLPFTDRIHEEKVDRRWQVVWIENRWLRVMILPELGGRIHRILDKTNNYDLIYFQPVIKPALVGLAGPWISGGIEFNWPQHHRPATFLPASVEFEKSDDGSITVWCSDHDVMSRMKGMHGVCLHPDRALVELKARVYNRTPFTQTFLWWANVATQVHEAYQSFFPPDVHFVADHAKRAVSTYPECSGLYYGVDYAARARRGVPKAEAPPKYVPPHCGNGVANLPSYAPNDLSWYANIATPCSYMCLGSKHDFFGGYDHFAKAGIVHIADHRISPGKKQWTWGNHPFGYAWDRNLTDARDNGEHPPYIELMAGVYTDNQPDFSFLQPFETKSWSQFWYPIRDVGPVQQANVDVALSIGVRTPGRVRIGATASRTFSNVAIVLRSGSRPIRKLTCDLKPNQPVVREVKFAASVQKDFSVLIVGSDGTELLRYESESKKIESVPPSPATEAPPPESVRSADELYVIGKHLEQYRHATRCPTAYWREALRRDPLDCRCNNAMGLWHLRRGDFAIAETHFKKAIERLTSRNPNPPEGEPLYNLGLCLRFQAQLASGEAATELSARAYDAFYKATWNHAWCSSALTAIAELDCARGDWPNALEHLEGVLRRDSEHSWARNLKPVVLRKLGRGREAEETLKATLQRDPLDWCARYSADQPMRCDLQTALDIAHDFARAGLEQEAARVLELTLSEWPAQNTGGSAKRPSGRRPRRASAAFALPDQSWGAEPLVHYTLAWLHARSGAMAKASAHRRRAAQVSVEYCFPARLEEIAVFKHASASNPRDARALYLLGNLFYDRRRYGEAIQSWERSAKLDPKFATTWRNLGIAYFNVEKDGAKAARAYEKAVQAAQGDARLIYERDQLWKRSGRSPQQRLAELEARMQAVRQRDDLSIELCALYNQTGQPERALEVLRHRTFQPWEGGEGQALGQHVRTHLTLGRRSLLDGDADTARRHFEEALESPANLGEAKHILANQSDIHYWLGIACAVLGDSSAARSHWTKAATFKGDFQEMKVRSYSEMTYYSALSWQKLGREKNATELLRGLLAYARELADAPATIDYFATSLPAMLLFEDDLQGRQKTTALFLEAQARLGLGEAASGTRLLKTVLERDPNHAAAADLLTEL